MLSYYIYILQSQRTSAYYVGSSKNISLRIHEHNAGRVKSTKNHRPWILIHQEKFSTRSQAIQRERQIKSWKKRSAIEKLVTHSIIPKDHRGSSTVRVGP